MRKKVRMGMVGGGEGAFIGAIHRLAANLDGQIELVCGAFSADAERSLASGQQLYLPASRCYASYQQMFAAESQLPADQRMQFVAIVTPNHLHFSVAKLALTSGFDVLSDKPATLTLAEALELQKIINQSQRLYGLTHTYTGYPLVKHARALVAQGELGVITKVIVEYSQGWLADPLNDAGKQASWRLNKAQAGISCCMADIGVHAANLLEYVSGLSITSLCADLNRVVTGRTLDDDGTILLQLSNGSKGVLLASQVASGEENNIRLRIYGDKGSLDWSQMEPNNLWIRYADSPAQLIRPGVGALSPAAQQATRTPAGHPEGYIEAFANIYQNFVSMIRAAESGAEVHNEEYDVPGIAAAIRGMAFIEQAVAASESEQKWHPFTIGNEQ